MQLSKRSCIFVYKIFENLKNYIFNNKWFIGAYLIVLLLTSLLLLISNSESVSLYVNDVHNPFLNIFFKYVTHFGEGWFAVPACLFLLYKNKKWGTTAIIISVSSALITQFNKHFVFENAHRPALILKDFKLNFVDGVEILNYHSFPSGHTTFAFAIFTCFAFIYRKPIQQIFFLFCAILVAFSRIYLLQHFLRDTIVGSMIGFVCAFVLFYLLISKKEGILTDNI
jgi:membrane-associated phospholipid phosphatase